MRRDDEALGRLLTCQDGLVTRSQALAAGLTAAAIRHRLAAGRWQTVLAGIYLVSAGEVSVRQRLRTGLLLGGDTAQLAGITACRLHGLHYVPADDGLVHVLLDHRAQRSSHGFVVVHRTTRLPWPMLRHDLPVSPVARAVFDAARRMRPLRDVRAVAADAVQRRLTTPGRLADEVAAGPSAGSALPREVVTEIQLGLRSAPECEFRDLIRSSRVLPEPEWNARVFGADGQPLAIADALWRRVRMLGEVNSREHHFYGETWEATMRRHARLAAAGFLVVPVSPNRIRTAPAAVLREYETAYLTRAAQLGGTAT
jgi:hypothetical protein